MSVYPSLRETAQKHEEEVQPAQLDNHLIGLKYLLILEPLPQVSEHKKDIPQDTEVQKCYVPNLIVPKVPTSEGSDKDDRSVDGDMIRDGPVPRPRAVLSSPDNDLAIGNQNRVKDGMPLVPSVVKDGRQLAQTNNTVQNRHWRCKAVSHNNTKSDHATTCKLKEVTNNKIEVSQKDRPVTASSSRKRVVGTKKSSS